MITKAVLYARVSSKEQEKEGYSIPAQLKLLAEYAQKNGLNVVREFVDTESAKGAGRAQFGEMVKFLHSNKKIKTVLVEKTDRLYRNFRDYITLEDLDLKVHLVKEGEVLSGDSRSHVKFVHTIKLAVAQNFIHNLSEETKKGMQAKAEQGLWPSYAPFGYRNIDKKIEPDPGEAPIVRQIYEWYATGNHSLSVVCNMCRQSFRGKTFAKSHVEKILKNPLYYGDFSWNGKLYKGLHAPLVSKRQWDAVREVFGRANKPKKTKKNFPFSGMLTCAHCGCAITAEEKKAKYTYYFCTGNRGPCSRPRIRQEALEEKLGEVIKNIVVPDDVASWLVRALEEGRRGTIARNTATLKKIRAEYKSLDTKIDTLLEDRLRGKIPEDLCYQKINEFRNKQASLKEQIELYEKADGENVPATATRLIELANKAYRLYLRQDAYKKGTLLKIVQSNSTWDGVSVCPTYRKPFDVIAESVKTGDWLPREDSNL